MSPFPRPAYRGLERYAPDRRPVAVDLSDNTNLWGPHPAALSVCHDPPPDALTRYPSVYADDLRDAVSSRFGVPASCVTTGCGSDDLLDSAFRAASAPGGRVVYAAPTFSMIPAFARMNGLEAVPVGWDDALGDPGRLLDEAPDLVYLCSPNNPTGATPPAGWVERLLEAGGPGGPVVVLDEAYADFAGRSLLGRAPETDRLLVLRTFSKAYGLAGLRIGFAVGAPTVVGEVEKARGPYKVGRVDEIAAVRALRDPAGWVDQVVEKTVAARARLAGALEERGLPALPSRANFLLVPVPARGAEAVTRRLRALGVAVRPFPGLDGIGDAVRVTVGPPELMDRFLCALDAILKDADGGPAGDGGKTAPAGEGPGSEPDREGAP